MSENTISDQAIIEPGAQIGENVVVEPFAIIKKNVVLHDNVTIKSHSYIDGNTTIGAGSVVYPSVSIGTKPQHLKYHGETTRVVIGKNCVIREFVTINSSSEPGSEVSVGDECLLMAYSHVAHDCRLGNKVILSNHAQLAGHVVIEDHAIIGGLTPIHQFVRIGRYAMVGGMSRVTHDIPPYTLGAGVPFKFGGLNLVGLKRHGFDLKTRKALSQAFRIMYRSGAHLEEAIAQTEAEVDMLPEIEHWISFAKNSRRGLMGLQGVGSDEHDGATLLEDCVTDYDSRLASFHVLEESLQK